MLVSCEAAEVSAMDRQRSRSPRREETASQKCFLFVGNPGTGKSTIINGLIGEPVFKAGCSKNGAGLTFQFDSQDVVGFGRVMDTPGLADEKMKEKAAQAITTALKQDGFYRIFFVMTLQAGRVMPQDKATMKLILEAAPTITDYSIIVNKVSRGWVKQMMDKANDKDHYKEWMAYLTAGLPKVTANIHFMYRDTDLDDCDDVKYQAPEDVVQFIKCAPGMNVRKEDVKPVVSSEIKKATDEFNKIQTQFQVDKNMLMGEIQKNRAALADARKRADDAAKAVANAKKDADDADRRAAKADKEKNDAEERARREKNKGPNFGRIIAGIFSAGLSELADWD